LGSTNEDRVVNVEIEVAEYYFRTRKQPVKSKEARW
jgi:hypothetical protein